MQIKTIEKTVKQKMEDWLETISDVQLRKDVRENILVSGGCIASLLLNEPVNDYDVYLQDMDVLKRLCQYYTKGLETEIWDGREKDKLVENKAKEDITIDGVGRASSALRNLKPNQIMIWLNHADNTGGLTIEKDVEDKNKYTPLHFSPNAISLSDDVQIVVRFWGTT